MSAPCLQALQALLSSAASILRFCCLHGPDLLPKEEEGLPPFSSALASGRLRGEPPAVWLRIGRERLCWHRPGLQQQREAWAA